MIKQEAATDLATPGWVEFSIPVDVRMFREPLVEVFSQTLGISRVSMAVHKATEEEVQ